MNSNHQQNNITQKDNRDHILKCGKTETDSEGNTYIIWRYRIKGVSHESERDYGANGITGRDSLKAYYNFK
jgi:hypothetical protein